MKLADLYKTALLWSCYLENFPRPERYLDIYKLTMQQRLLFDSLGQFFPFDEYYIRAAREASHRGLTDLRQSDKSLIVPWIYWPLNQVDRLHDKEVIAPSLAMFQMLDDKLATKRLFQILDLPTPKWGNMDMHPPMVEKPIRDSAGGLGIRLTKGSPRDGCFLEEYMPGFQSVGIQYFAYGDPDFICADEMLFDGVPDRMFTFHAQRNVLKEELPAALLLDCDKLVACLIEKGYRGFIGIDVLVREDRYCFLEINPRGIAFLPAFFAASAQGWKHFKSYTRAPSSRQEIIVLLDFGSQHRVVERLP
jgi:hypothetical protein